MRMPWLQWSIRRCIGIGDSVFREANAAIGRGLIKAVSRDGLGGSSCVVFEEALEKQKEGKKRMKRVGKVEIPQEAFLAILKVE